MKKVWAINSQQIAKRRGGKQGIKRDVKTGIARNRVLVRSFVGGLAAMMATMLLISGVTMTTANAAVEPRPNPDLQGSCGQNVAVVADLSWSMEPLVNGYPDPDASLPKLKKALGTYLEGLQGSNTNVALYTFGSYSPDIDPADKQTTGGNVNYKLTSVQAKAGVDELKTAISKWRGFGWTRWDLGLQKVADSTDKYDYVLFITDGYPTTASGGDIPNQDGIITAANNVKAKGTKIIVIFAPSGGLSMTSTQEKNIQAISGKTTDKTGTEVLQNDYYSSNWTIIGEQLAAMANKCAPTIAEDQMEATRTIHYVDANGQAMAPDAVQKVSYTKKTDLSSNEVTYEPKDLSFGPVDTPDKPGFAPDRLSVGSTTVSAGPDPIALVETVRYTPVFSNPNSNWTVVPTTSVAGETIPYANGNSTGQDYWTATLTATNQTGAVVTDLDVSAISFTVNSTKGVTISSPVTDNKDGTYSVTISSTVAASPEVTVTYGGQQVGEKKTISFQSGAFSYDKSTFDVSPRATSGKNTWVTVSEGTNYYTATLTAADDYENPLTDLTADDIVFSAIPSAKVAITDVVNHQDGTYTVRYSSTLADMTGLTKLAQVTYQGTTVGTPKPIPFKAGDESVNPTCDDGIDGTNLSVDKNSLSAGDTSHATALVTDEFCNVKEGVTVTFTLDPGKSGTVTPASRITDQYGKAYADVTDDVAETVTLHATITAGEINSARDITFIAGDLDTANSTFDVYRTDPDATTVVADGEQSWTGKLVARDKKGNLLPKLDTSEMVFTVVPGGVKISDASNEGGGVYTVTYTSTKAGSYTAALTYNGSKVGEYQPISFVADVVDGTHSLVSVNPSHQVAGSPVKVTVTVRDKNDNPVLGLNADDVVVVGTAAKLPDLTISGFTRLPNGVYTYQATSKLVGEFEVTATVNGVLVDDAPHVVFIAGDVCGGNATPEDPNNITKFVMGDNDAVADGVHEDSATAYAFDCFGNPVEGATVTVVDMSADELVGYLTPANHAVTTGPEGTVTVRWTSTKAGIFTAVGMIDGSYREGSFMDIRFGNGQGNAKKSSLVVTPYTGTPIIVENFFTATVTVRDETGNKVAGENVSFWLDPVSPARLSADYCTTGEDGTCKVTVTSDLVTKVAIHAVIRKDELGGNGVEVEKSPQTVEFTAGPVCVVDCHPVDPTHVTRVVVTTDGVVANGEDTDVAKAFAYDRKGNAVEGIVVTSSTSDSALGTRAIAETGADGITDIHYTSTVAGAHTAFVLIDSKRPTQAVNFDQTTTTDGRITLNFGSDAASAKDSSLTIDPTTSQQVNSTFTVTVHVVDGKNNAVSNVVVGFPAVDGLSFNKTSCTSGKDGTCQVTVTSRLMGTYTVSAKLGNDDLNTVDAVFTPGPVCVPTVDECDPENGHYTHVEVTRDGATANGEDRDVATVRAYDRYGNPVKDVLVQSAPRAGETFLTVQSNVIPTDADGMTTIWYTSTVRGGHQADVTIGGKNPKTSPITVSFGSGDGDADHSSWVVAPKNSLPTPLTVGQGGDNTYTATATVKDAQNNPVKDAVVTFSIDPSGSPVFTPENKNTCQTDDQGKCSVSVYSTTSGAYSMQAKITDGWIKNAVTHDVSASLAWKADSVCSKAAGCDPVNPGLAEELRTRVEIVDNNKTADGVERDTVIVWAFDQWGNPVEGALVQSTSDDSTLTIQTGISSVNKDGFSTIRYTSTVAGDHIASVLVDDITPVNAPVTLTFVSGDLSPDTSTFKVFRTNLAAPVVVADGVQSWTGSLVARDKNYNLLSGLDIDDMAFTVASDDVTVSDVSEKGNGVYVVTYTSTKSGSYAAALTYNGDKVGSNETISFVAGIVNDKHSTVTVSPPRQVAGSSVTVTVTARDVNDNLVLGLNADDIVVVGTAVDLPDLTISNFSTIADGVYTYQATSQLIGDFEVRATVTDILLDEKPHVVFYSGGVCVNGATPVVPGNVTRFEAVVPSALANGVDQVSAMAYAYDCLGNPVEGASVVVGDKSTGDLAGYLRPEQQSVTTDSEGTALVYWTSTKAGLFTAEGTINNLRPATGVMNWIRFNSGLGDPSKSELVVTPESPIQVGNSYTAKVTVRDATGNLAPGETVSFSVDPSSPAKLSENFCTTGLDGTCSVRVSSDLVTTVAIHATLPKDGHDVGLRGNGDTAKASPQTVEFVAGGVCVVDCHPVDPTHVTRVEVVTDGSVANGEAIDVAKVWAYDNTGNPTPGKVVTSSTYDPDLGIKVVARTDEDGTAEIHYTSTTAGPHVALVIVDSRIPTKAQSSDGIRDDGRITVNFGSGAASAKNSDLTISPAESQQVNSTFTVTAHVRDANLNNVSGSVVTFPAVENLTFDKTSCVSGADGTCQVTVSSRLVGTYEVRGQLNQQDLSNTVNAVFTAGQACVPTVDVCDPVNPDNVSRVKVTLDGQTADGLSHDVATVWVYDYDGNPVTDALIQSAPAAGETKLTVQPNVAPTNADGVTTIWYASTVKGGHKADVTIGGKSPETSPITVSFGSGDGDTDRSSWVVAPSGPLTVGQGANSTYVATATVRDKANNPVQDATVVFSIDPSVSPVFTPQNTCQTDEQGTCSVSVYSTTSGTYSMTASITSGPIKNAGTREVSAPVAWKADSVCSKAAGCDPVNPGLAEELRTRVEIVDNNKTADGVERDTVIVWAFDQWGNPVEGALVQSTSDNTDLNIQTGIPSVNKDGSATIWYTSMVAGTYPASIFVDAQKATDTVVELTFVTGPVCVVEAGCEPVGPGTDPKRQTYVAVKPNDQPVNNPDLVVVYAFDKTGNAVSGAEFQIRTDDATLSFVGSRTRMAVAVASGENNTVAGTSAIGGSHAASALVNGVELTRHGSPMDLRFLGAPMITSPQDGGLSKDKPLVIKGTGQTPGDRIVVTEGTDQVCEAVVRDNLTWSCEASLKDGSHTLTAVESNENGVDSPESTPVTVVIDTIPPAPPSVDESKGSQVTGTTEPDTTVTVTDKDGKPVEGCVDVVPDEQGNFSCTPTTPIPPETTVKVTAVDPAGNVSGPTPLDIVALQIEVVHETRDPGQDQVISGYKFNPGEQVCLFLGETEMSCGTADEKGMVTFTFTVPSSTLAGPQVVTLRGAESGNVSCTFKVSVIQVQTGGIAHHSGAPWALTVGCLLAVAGALGTTRWVAAVKK